jgi:antitoxin MazE
MAPLDSYQIQPLNVHRRSIDFNEIEVIMAKSATVTIQRWGNSMAVRLPASVARSAHLGSGQLVEVSAQHSRVLIKTIGESRLTLAQMLAKFDPARHGGEAIATADIGQEELR